MEQIDPGLLEEIARGPEDEPVRVIVRLRDRGVVPDGVRVVAELGDVVTADVRRGDILRVHDSDEVESMKAPGSILPGDLPDALSDDAEAASDVAPRPTDGRRPARDPAAGRGVVVAVLDWWFDLRHPAFLRPDGTSRVAALWDQRNVTGVGRRPDRYGYGRVLGRDDINRCLRETDPYAALNYRPWDGADAGRGTHGTHVAGIAAGSPHAGVSGVAPLTDLVLVHLADNRPQAEGAGLGDSASLLEAVDFVTRAAGEHAWSLNISAGRHAGHHRGTTLVERALDNAVTGRAGRFVSQSAGNYYRERVHAFVEISPGAERRLTWDVETNDPTPNQLDAWYAGVDVLQFALRAPGGETVVVPLGQSGELRAGTRLLARVYHRQREPNTGLNNIRVFMQSGAPGGDWRVTLYGSDVVDGRVHLWVERDDPYHQSRFAETDAVATTTTGTICNGFHTIATGAFDPHSAGRPVGRSSSSGPTADGRRRPSVLGPGVDILAPRSAPSAAGPHGLVRKTGTSMAAPHVAGAMACLLEVTGARAPVAVLRRLLLTSLDEAVDRSEQPYRTGLGYLDLDQLLAAGRAYAASSRAEEGASAVLLPRPFVPPPLVGATVETEEAVDRAEPSDAAEVHDYLKDRTDLLLVPMAPAALLPVPTAGTGGQRALAATFNRIGGLAGALAALLGVPLPAVLAVWYVESGGRPHRAGQTLTRFENHLLWRSWGRANADAFDTHFQVGGRPPRTGPGCEHPWQCHYAREDPSQPFVPVHSGQPQEAATLALATRLSGEDTALRCASFGGTQILGRHHARLGYASPREMFDAFRASEQAEVLGFFDFCRSVPGLVEGLRARDWATVARLYNGAGQVERYSARLAAGERDIAALLQAGQPSAAARESTGLRFGEPRHPARIG